MQIAIEIFISKKYFLWVICELCEDPCQKLKRSVYRYSVKGRRIDVLWIRVCRSMVTRIKDAKQLFTWLIKALLILTREKMELDEGQQKKMSCRSEVSVWENRLRPWKNFHPAFPVESTPIPFLIGINGSFTVHIYAFMQYQTAILHKIRAFRAFRCILCNLEIFLKKIEFLCKINFLYRVVWYYILATRK